MPRQGRVPTQEMREQFLELIRGGEVRHKAATDVESTSSAFKGLIGRDPEFRRLYAEALEESGRQYDEEGARIDALEKLQLARKVFDEYVERALNPEAASNGSSNRLLHNLALLLSSTFKPLLEARMHRHVHEGAVGIYALPQLDTAKWTLEQHEEFVKVDQRRSELLAIAIPDDETRGTSPPRPALPASEFEVIDMDAEEE